MSSATTGDPSNTPINPQAVRTSNQWKWGLKSWHRKRAICSIVSILPVWTCLRGLSDYLTVEWKDIFKVGENRDFFSQCNMRQSPPSGHAGNISVLGMIYLFIYFSQTPQTTFTKTDKTTCIWLWLLKKHKKADYVKIHISTTNHSQSAQQNMLLIIQTPV